MSNFNPQIVGVATVLALGSLTAAATTSIAVMDKRTLTLYYWPFMGRAGAVVRMLDATKTPYKWISVDRNHPTSPESVEMLSMLSARARPYHAVTGTCTDCDTFAPPVVVDGDAVVSQSVAVAMHVGDRVGFGGTRIPSIPKAVQYMNDVADFCSEAMAAALSPDAVVKVRAFIEGGRMDAWLSNIEHSISGPYYFGQWPSYVDFHLLHMVDWAIEDAFLIALTPKLEARGISPLSKVPKLRTLLALLRAEPWYGTQHKYPLNVDGERMKPESVAAY